MSSKVNTLTPTDGIKDPQVRAFCESLSNVWQLRNGNIGADDKERFITKQEWDYLAKNPNIRAIAGIGQPGSSPTDPGGDPRGPGGPPTVVPDWIQNLIDFLASGITLIDFTKARETSDKLYATYFALTTELRTQANNFAAQIKALEDDITQINTISKDSTSKSAQAVWGMKESIEDPDTGLDAATAGIIEINKVHVEDGPTTSANANATRALLAQVNGPNGTAWTTAMILAIEDVSATTTSANAKKTYLMDVQVNDPVTGLEKAHADIAEISSLDVTSDSAIVQTVNGMSAQVVNNTANITAINNVNVNSASANASALAGLQVSSGVKSRTFASPTAPVSTPPAPPGYILTYGDIWIDTSVDPATGFAKNTQRMWNGTAWVDVTDTRLVGAAAGISTESTVRANHDTALAKQLNAFWAQVGSNNALIIDETNITANPIAASADYFKQVQAAVTDPNTGKVTSAALKQDFDAYVNKDTGIANASYSLIVQAQNPGGKAVAGMTITANVKPQPSAPESAVIFLADNFGIYNSAATNRAEAPFFVSGGVVRLNIAHIKDYIQSDIFARPGDPTYPNGKGWRINANGDAEFYGASTFAEVYAGSTLVDPISFSELGSVAVGSWSSTLQSGATYKTDPKLRMYGSNYHSGVPQNQRIRIGDAQHQLMTTLMFTGVADHWISIWRKHSSASVWTLCNKTTTPSVDYNACTCAWAGLLTNVRDGYWDFAVSPTNESLTPFDVRFVELRDFTLAVTMQNI